MTNWIEQPGMAGRGLMYAADDVVLVDDADVAIGRSAKLAAHRAPGVLHRAFSVVLFDERNRLLLQRRARTKYHFGGCWSNSCCGHPRPGEAVTVAATRRVSEELGLHVTLRETACFEYRAEDPASGLVEHEIDHVMWGSAHRVVLAPDPLEVDDWRWIDKASLGSWMQERPADFTPWFAPVVTRAWDTWR